MADERRQRAREWFGGRRPKRRNAMSAAVVVLLSTLASLLVAEVVVRQLGLAPEVFAVQKGRFRISDNPLLGYELVPHFQADASGPMVDFRGVSNSLGFRDREHPIAKPAGTFRAIVIGDSITQGLKVRDDAAVFTAILEQRLRERHDRRVEVMNFGVSGYNTQQEVETLRQKGLVYAPDLVILAYCLNDTGLHSGGILPQLTNQHRKQDFDRIPRLLTRSALFRLVHARLASLAPDERDLFPEIEHDTVLQSLDALAELAREHRFAVLVVSFPRLWGVAEENEAAEFAALERAATSHGFHFLDLADTMTACAAGGRIKSNYIHPNARGHRCAGEAIAGYVAGVAW